jgi:predicted enzyme related to lactoylglutathione lyase
MAIVADAGHAVVGMWQPGEHAGFGRLAEPGTPGWFELHTRDFDKSVEFYRTVFGWDTHVASDEPDFRYTTLGEGDAARAGIMDAGSMLPSGVPPHWVVYFSVASTDEALARIGELGGRTIVPPEDTPYGRLATAADPMGAVFRLVG